MSVDAALKQWEWESQRDRALSWYVGMLSRLGTEIPSFETWMGKGEAKKTDGQQTPAQIKTVAQMWSDRGLGKFTTRKQREAAEAERLRIRLERHAQKRSGTRKDTTTDG